MNPCMPGLVTTNRLTTVLSASVAHANALRERLYNETAFYSKVAFILERLLANAGETFDALKVRFFIGVFG